MRESSPLSWTLSNDPETALQEKNRGEVLREALTKLSTEHREIIDLVYYHEKSIEECAQILAIPLTVPRAAGLSRWERHREARAPAGRIGTGRKFAAELPGHYFNDLHP
jgi:stress-induced morphogen